MSLRPQTRRPSLGEELPRGACATTTTTMMICERYKFTIQLDELAQWALICMTTVRLSPLLRWRIACLLIGAVFGPVIIGWWRAARSKPASRPLPAREGSCEAQTGPHHDLNGNNNNHHYQHHRASSTRASKLGSKPLRRPGPTTRGQRQRVSNHNLGDVYVDISHSQSLGPIASASVLAVWQDQIVARRCATWRRTPASCVGASPRYFFLLGQGSSRL